jgi:hypothetical protein
MKFASTKLRRIILWLAGSITGIVLVSGLAFIWRGANPAAVSGVVEILVVGIGGLAVLALSGIVDPPTPRAHRGSANHASSARPALSVTGWTWMIRVGVDDWKNPPHADRLPISVDLPAGESKNLLRAGEAVPVEWRNAYQYYRCLEITTLTNRGWYDCEVEVYGIPIHAQFGAKRERLHLQLVKARRTWSSSRGVLKIAAPVGYYFAVEARPVSGQDLIVPS